MNAAKQPIMRVVNKTRQTVLVNSGRVAATPWSRLVGLLGQNHLDPGAGLLLRGEQAIHMLGMRFAIDVVYLDAEGHVLRAIDNLAPWRLGPFVRKSRDVLELPAGTLAATGTCEGDKLVFEFGK